MAPQRLIFVFIILGLTVFFLARKDEDTPASAQKVSGISTGIPNRPDNNRTGPRIISNPLNEVEQKRDTTSAIKPQQVTIRKAVPRNAIRGASSAGQNRQVSAQAERSTLFEGTSWKILDGVRAYPKKNGRPTLEITGEVSGFYLVKESTENSDIRNFSASQPLVVFDSRLGVVGVVTGVFSVTLKEGVSSEILTQAAGIKVLNSFPGIRTYFITSVAEPFDLQAFQESLKNETDIELVHVEILSRQYEKN